MFTKRKSSNESQVSSPSGATPPRQASRPDVSAVLDRQPQPPVREPLRRAADYAPATTTSRPDAKREEATEGKKLIVGFGIKLSGEITACEKLVVEGEVHADLSGAQVLEIADRGLFKGRATVDYAEISGTFQGELTVRERLMLRGSGQIEGDLHYAELEVERGGRIRGTIAELDGKANRARPAQSSASPSPQDTPSASVQDDEDLLDEEPVAAAAASKSPGG